jgi:DNA-binding XRE family transcriptional regulator
MEGRHHPQAALLNAHPPTYAGRTLRATLPSMDLQLTPRSSRHAVRFPNTIREYRLKAGLSQRRLAGLLGRGKDAVSSWERGLSLPSVPLLMRMAKILDTLAESLYRDFYATFPHDGSPTNPAKT